MACVWQVLSEEEAARAQSALDGLAVFLDALLAVNTAQKQRHEACEQQPDGLQIADSPEKVLQKSPSLQPDCASCIIELLTLHVAMHMASPKNCSAASHSPIRSSLYCAPFGRLETCPCKRQMARCQQALPERQLPASGAPAASPRPCQRCCRACCTAAMATPGPPGWGAPRLSMSSPPSMRSLLLMCSSKLFQLSDRTPMHSRDSNQHQADKCPSLGLFDLLRPCILQLS